MAKQPIKVSVSVELFLVPTYEDDKIESPAAAKTAAVAKIIELSGQSMAVEYKDSTVYLTQYVTIQSAYVEGEW